VSAYTFERNAVLVASAGTGKTHTLVGVLLHLLLGESHGGEPVPAARIVATTFSRKAAREIRERLARELETLSTRPEASKYLATFAETRRALGRPELSVKEIARKALKARASADDVVCGTLHGFALGVLRSFAVEAGLPYGVDISEESEVRARRSAAIVRAIEARSIAGDADTIAELVSIMGGIEPLVSRVREHFEGCEELGLSVADLVASGADVGIIEGRWLDLRRKVAAMGALPRYEQAVRAFEATFAKGAAPTFEAAEAALDALGELRKSPKPKPEEADFHAFLDELPRPADRKRTKLLRLYCAYSDREALGARVERVRGVLAACEAELAATRRAAAGLGFGEVLGNVAELLERRPDVAAELGRRYDVLLVDEFQDTSRLQKRIVELLWAKPSARERGGETSLADVRGEGLLVVGDRKQSIYGFRGADVSVFAELCVGLAGVEAREKLRVAPGTVYEPKVPVADLFPLRTNRRSEHEILRFVNAFAAASFATAEAKPELFELAYSPEIEDLVAPAELAGERLAPRVQWVRPELRTSGKSADGKGRVAVFSTRRDEARCTTRIILDLVAGRRDAHLGEGKVASYKDCAVLALTNEMLDEMAYALAEADVPYVLAGKSFYRAREVLDLTALLSLLVDPSDKLAALTVLRGPFAGVSDATLLALTEPGRGLTRVSAGMLEGPRAGALAEGDPERNRVLRVVEVVERIHPILGRLGPGAALRAASGLLGYEATLAALPRGRGKVANARKLLDLADLETDPRALVGRVLSRAQGTDDEGEASTFSEEDDAVRLLTVHASKGLDFPIVFFPQAGAIVTDMSRPGPFVIERGADSSGARRTACLGLRVPHPSGVVYDTPTYERARAMGVRRDRAERKRLLYVALTRASHMLFLVGHRRASKSADAKGKATETACSAVLDAVCTAPSTAELLTVEDVPTAAVDAGKPAPTAAAPRAPAPPESPEPPEPPESPAPARAPTFRVLHIAPTSLQDAHHCTRRFQLVHLLGLPEHPSPAVRGVTGPRERGPVTPPEPPEPPESPGRPAPPAPPAAAGGAPAERAPLPLLASSQDEGTRMHRVLERLDASVLGGALGEAATAAAIAAGLVREGLPREHPRHTTLARRLHGFVSGAWLAGSVALRATLHRELPFAVEVPLSGSGESRVLLRGAMDLVAVNDDEVLVVDYKRARGPGLAPYAFQLRLYVHAARALFPGKSRVRAGVVFLGGDPREPLWLPDEPPTVALDQVRDAAERLQHARFSGVFPRVPRPACEAIHCGYVGRCHPRTLTEFAAET